MHKHTREVGSINDPLHNPEPLWLAIERICHCMTAVLVHFEGEWASLHIWPQTVYVVILHLS